MSTFSDRIRFLLDSRHLTQTAFAEKLDITPAYVTKLLKNPDAAPSSRLIKSICLEFGASEDWLRTGEGKPFLNQTDNITQFSAAHPAMSDVDKALMEAYFSLSEDQKEAFLQYCLSVAEAWQARNGQKKSAAARSGDRAEVAQVSPEEEESALPPDYAGDI